jgi:dTDP-4-dehydrorhamnose 3,5-epimerase
MIFKTTSIEGAFLVELEPHHDERGFLSRLFCAEEFRSRDLEVTIAQINNSVSTQAGTLRGLHYQVSPAGEAKLVRCIRGSAYDLVIDVRERSTTFGSWYGAELTADNRHMMYVPKGCAHGYLTLRDDTEILYTASAPYSSGHERVVRWNDPKFGVLWPRDPAVLSDKDRLARDFMPYYHLSGY